MEFVPRCYVASPLGFSESGRYYYVEVLLPALRNLVEVVCPWEMADSLVREADQRGGLVREDYLRMGDDNRRAIEGCALLVAVLDGQEVDSGTAAEIGYAAARGVRCFGLRTDLRQTGEPGMAVNLQVEHFIEHSGGRVVPSLEELLAALRAA